jgi:hypothetical protein
VPPGTKGAHPAAHICTGAGARPWHGICNDWAHPCHICTRTGLTRPHRHQDWPHPCHATGLTPAAAPRTPSSSRCRCTAAAHPAATCDGPSQHTAAALPAGALRVSTRRWATAHGVADHRLHFANKTATCACLLRPGGSAALPSPDGRIEATASGRPPAEQRTHRGVGRRGAGCMSTCCGSGLSPYSSTQARVVSPSNARAARVCARRCADRRFTFRQRSIRASD